MKSKRRRTRAETDFQREWTAGKIATIANMGLLGYTSKEIVKELNDHTMHETVRSMLSRWGVFDRAAGDGRKRLAIRLHPKACNDAKRLAERAGMPLDLFLGQALEFVIRDDLFESIMDGEVQAYAVQLPPPDDTAKSGT